MGRKKLAETILDNLSDHEDVVSNYLVVWRMGGSSWSAFYRQMDDLLKLTEDGVRVVNNVIKCSRSLTALAVRDLARHYGAGEVSIYSVHEILNDKREPDGDG